MRKLGKILLVIGVIAGALWLAPWKNLLGGHLQKMLAAQGLQNVRLELSGLNLNGANFKDVAFDKDNMKVSIAQGDVSPKGDWHLRDIHVEMGSSSLPALEGSGNLKAGQFRSKDNTYQADFTFDSAASRLTLKHATMPWKNGTLAVKNVTLPLGGKQPVSLTLQVEKISIDELLQALTGQKVSATGAVSGNIPLTVAPDGTVSFGKGELQATGPGIITMPPDAIPGDNEQIALTREILKNFHYQSFMISISNGAGKKTALLVALEGNNPEMFGGRAVKLNVRLGGDILDFIRQNVIFLTDPETILHKERP